MFSAKYETFQLTSNSKVRDEGNELFIEGLDLHTLCRLISNGLPSRMSQTLGVT